MIKSSVFFCSASDPKGTQDQESDFLILAPDLLLIIEASIFSFHRFLKMDKKTSNSGSLSFRNQTQDATLLARIRSSLDKVWNSVVLSSFFPQASTLLKCEGFFFS